MARSRWLVASWLLAASAGCAWDRRAEKTAADLPPNQRFIDENLSPGRQSSGANPFLGMFLDHYLAPESPRF